MATVHDLGYHYFPEAHTKTQVIYLRWSTRHNARRSQHVLADSEATKADLQKFYGTQLAKINVVYPALTADMGAVKDAGILAQTQAKYQVPQNCIKT